MSYVENTSNRDALLHLLGTLENRDDPSRYITDMEAAGQRQLVNSDQLPTDCGDEQPYLDLGFVFAEVVDGDPLFRHVTLPDGWKREGADHAMWSNLLDGEGRRRVSIFYKAAFYDRRAAMYLTHPTSVLSDLEYGDADPVSLPIDDLLTVDMAREWLTERAAHLVEYGYGPERVARIDLMLGLLP